MYLGQSRRAYSDVCSFDFGNAGWYQTIYRFTERLVITYTRNLWLLSSSDIYENVRLRGVGRLGNSAEPLRFQRV